MTIEINEQTNKFNTIVDKYINPKKINHAYLIETNCNDRIDIALELVKKIISFDSNNSIEYLLKQQDLYVLSTDTQSIKKEEIITLKEKFKTKSIYNSKRIYIIEEAEKLNSSSANTLLKFLEEPEEDIIAILIAANRNLVIDTIISRCQIIRFYNKKEFDKLYDIEKSKQMFEFIGCIEQYKEQSIAYVNSLEIKNCLDRQNLNDFFKQMLYLYDDVLHKKLGLEIEYYLGYEDKINEISEKNTLIQIKRKINAINDCIERIKYNANSKLLLDKLIILMTGVEINV